MPESSVALQVTGMVSSVTAALGGVISVTCGGSASTVKAPVALERRVDPSLVAVVVAISCLRPWVVPRTIQLAVVPSRAAPFVWSVPSG
jgi:hypothetical protein